jgi:hypothetical protein
VIWYAEELLKKQSSTKCSVSECNPQYTSAGISSGMKCGYEERVTNYSKYGLRDEFNFSGLVRNSWHSKWAGMHSCA